MDKEDILIRIKSTIFNHLFPSIFKKRRHIRDYFRLAKNGTITGAADNDPAGIVTYSQVGATTGFSLLWLMVLATPLLAAIEDMSARVGVVTKKSLIRLIDEKFGRKLVIFIAFIVAVCNIATIGADIAGMSEVLGILTNAPWFFFAILIAIFLSFLLIRGNYSIISRFFFLLTPIFLCYVVAALIVKPDLKAVLLGTINPFSGGGLSYWTLAVALLGTTLSPYLIFWQNTEEIEERKGVNDLENESLGVKTGMIYCNLISYFIIIATGAVLFQRGLSINTAQDAALALKPLAGEGAFYLFSTGLLGAGFLAVPILATSSAYIFSDIFHWKEGLDQKIWQARGFYLVLFLSLFLGLILGFLGLSPIKMLVYSQVLDGLLMPILIYFLIKIANNKQIMGQYINKKWVNFFGWLAFLIMLGFDIVLIGKWVL
jgi:Mn2+/Fe2+ NRAMP family transporter